MSALQRVAINRSLLARVAILKRDLGRRVVQEFEEHERRYEQELSAHQQLVTSENIRYERELQRYRDKNTQRRQELDLEF